jgi:sulfur-carrier protein
MMATLLYFAWVRERIGTADESLPLPSDVGTAGALLDLLIARGGGYAEALGARDKIRIAVNQAYVSENFSINDHDEIAFFPPVTGG